MPCNSNFCLQIRIYFELKLQIRNYFGLFLQIRTLFDLKFELQWDLLRIRYWGSHSLSPYLYIKGHVEMVDTKDQSNAIVYCVCYVFCRHCWYWCLCNEVWKLYFTLYTMASNTIYVNTVDTKHIHTFLPISFLIFNQFSIHKKFWKAETEGFSIIPSNTIYVNTVNTRHKYF